MSTLSDFLAANTANKANAQAVVDAQDTLSDAAMDAAIATTELTAAQDALTAAENADPVVQDDIDAAQAVVATKTTARATALTALGTATTALSTAKSTLATAAATALGKAAKLDITDYCMVPNNEARIYILSKGQEVRLEEPENIVSNHAMVPQAGTVRSKFGTL